jgi:hypothetical protein
VNKSSGNDTSSRLINGTPKMFEITDMIKTGFRIADMCSVKERLESNMIPRLRADLAGESATLSGSDIVG